MCASEVTDYPAIPGSRLRRAYCSRCREPMRITPAAADAAARAAEPPAFFCEQCDPGRGPGDRAAVLTARQRECLGRTRS